MSRELILLIGGSRSGKSALAQRLAARSRRVLFIATAEPGDAEMAGRIALHRSRRPPGWDTIEEPVEIASAIRRVTNASSSPIALAADRHDTVVLDCLTLWVSNLLREPDAEKRILVRARELLEAYEAGSARWIVVSNEVGAGLVPASALGRVYRDMLGRVNQLVAARADKVYLVSAGLAVDLKALGARPVDRMDEG